MKRKAVLLGLICLLLSTGPYLNEQGPLLKAEDRPADPFTVIVLPDTQGYSEHHPEIFLHQTKWIANHKEELNIKLVVHLGDVVEDPANRQEWERASRAIKWLDRNKIPTLLAFGNHDYTSLADGRVSNLFNDYFPLSRYRRSEYFGGTYNRRSADNIFFTFEIEGRKYLFLTVEYRPREKVLGWAKRVLSTHSEHQVAVISHSYMYPTGLLTESGWKVWNRLGRKHPNVEMILCGHVPASDVDVRYGEEGNKVTQMLSNYQYYSNGGNGFLRILTFYPREGKVKVQTYSPYLDSYKETSRDKFTFWLEEKEKVSVE